MPAHRTALAVGTAVVAGIVFDVDAQGSEIDPLSLAYHENCSVCHGEHLEGTGPGTSVIMAAFTHLNPEGSRFSDGSYGVFYAGRKLETAVAESKHHREGFLRATRQGPIEVDMKAYGLDLVGDLHDLRGRRPGYPEVHAADDHTAGRRLAAGLREDGANGIVYESVRHPGGECAAVFRPKLLSRVRRTRRLCFVWDGREIAWVYEKRFLSMAGSRHDPRR